MKETGRFETEPFRVSRTELALLGAQTYLRYFWWIALPPVLLGFPLLFMGGTPLMRALGAFFLAWPLTIVGRSFLLTGPVAKRMMRPTRLVADGDELTFHAEGGGGGRLRADAVRRLRQSGRFYVLETRRFGFALVPREAFRSEEDRQAFEALFAPESR